MPIYDYKCHACDYTHEVMQSLSEKPLSHCPSCNKPEFAKLLSAPRFQLKGSGWYETDFKSKKTTDKTETTTETT